MNAYDEFKVVICMKGDRRRIVRSREVLLVGSDHGVDVTSLAFEQSDFSFQVLNFLG
jgi:hypothetical protein